MLCPISQTIDDKKQKLHTIIFHEKQPLLLLMVKR
jgi:hypothetical protein